MKPITQIFYNPGSGTYSPRGIERLCFAWERAGFEVLRSESSAQSAIAVERSATHICVAGGDGTMRHVVAAVRKTGHVVPVSHYPAGTVNLLAREVDYPRHPDEFVKRILSAPCRRQHHVADLNDTIFLCCASVGPECVVIERHSHKLKRFIGKLSYVLAFAGILWTWPRKQMVLCADGKSYLCEAVYIAKGRYFAGPWSFAPKASMTDALLYVAILKTARRRDFLRFALALVTRRDMAEVQGVTMLVCERLSLLGETSVPVQADGDIVTHLPVSMACNPDPMILC